VLAGGERLWTVLGGDHRPVGPAEEFLEYLRVQRVSSNTVKSYARALALWWQYLQVFGLSWDAVTLEAVGGFLVWLRTGDGPQVVSIEQRSHLFRATPRQSPTGRHIVLKPGQAAGRRFRSQPIGLFRRYDQHRSASRNN
jgi:hypothetical protein